MASGTVAIVGSGPAALMAADVLAGGGISVTLFEKRKSAGRKLLVAGSSGLNISNALPPKEFASFYQGELPGGWVKLIESFPPRDWVEFIERDLDFKTFEGSSGRYFIREEGATEAGAPTKASKFLQAWLARLKNRGVTFRYGMECVDFAQGAGGVRLKFADGSESAFSRVLFALGGGSWEPDEKPLRWPRMFRDKGLQFVDFTPSNVGYRVAWPVAFLKEAEGLPLKKIVVTSGKTRREGDAMITKYGIEGTPIYFSGQEGTVLVDLRPDLSEERVLGKLKGVKENLSPIRRVKKTLSLCPAALALVFHLTPKGILEDLKLVRLAKLIKAFPLELLGPQPLDEAISSAGGLGLSEIDEAFQLRRFPGVYAVGEMLDWDVPTGGFLIQACVAQGRAAAQRILSALRG